MAGKNEKHFMRHIGLVPNRVFLLTFGDVVSEETTPEGLLRSVVLR